MHKWKQFIKGPDLHDELCSNSTSSTNQVPGQSSLSTLIALRESANGQSAKDTYEKIVNEPSTSNSNSFAAATISADIEEVQPQEPPPRKLRLTQLMSLCETNNIEQLSQYVNYYESEIDINEVDQYGWTLLMSAACSGSIYCVEFLLRAGSDWTLTDKSGLTAFRLAQKKHKTHVCELIGKWVKFRHSEEEHGESSESCDESSSSCPGEPKFCEPCRVNYTNEKEHFKSIAHLVSTSTYSNYDRVHYGIPESNKGFQLMLKTGWDRRGLGSTGDGQKFPVKTVLKRDRKGLGETGEQSSKKQAKITHFAPFDTAAVERQQPDTRLERLGTVKKKDEEKRRNKQKVKEIHYRRELGSI